MSESFTSALLAALNQSTEIEDNDWAALEAVLRESRAVAGGGQLAAVSTLENRFAATISSGMAKIRASR
jgi:hypothetical protein